MPSTLYAKKESNKALQKYSLWTVIYKYFDIDYKEFSFQNLQASTIH